jgi:hypothetical protein
LLPVVSRSRILPLSRALTKAAAATPVKLHISIPVLPVALNLPTMPMVQVSAI